MSNINCECGYYAHQYRPKMMGHHHVDYGCHPYDASYISGYRYGYFAAKEEIISGLEEYARWI